MKPEIYFLSIFQDYVSMIIRGEKQWEFRENPCFGRYEDGEIQVGDILFPVSVSQDPSQGSAISCLCRITDIRRGNEMKDYFSDEKSGHWKEAGCRENSERDWEFFQKNILNKYSTAVRLKVYPIEPAIKTSEITHKTKRTSWKGIGFMPANKLNRFSIQDAEIIDYFRKVAGTIINGQINL
jgi:hypothetical protein